MQTVVVAAGDVWAEVRRLRVDLADRIESLPPEQWDAESWCQGWRIREVLGHLVHLAEAGQVSMARDVVRGGGRPDRALDRAARRLGQRPVPELTARLRGHAGGRFRVLGLPPAAALGEVVVHGADALQPVGLEVDVGPAQVLPVLQLYRRLGRLAFHAEPARGRRLMATDVAWVRGSGPEIRGRAVDLLLLLANRRQVIPRLEGTGLAGRARQPGRSSPSTARS